MSAPNTDATRTFVGDVDDLHASAERATGLTEFGPDGDNHREGLACLLDSLHADAGLTPEGSKYFRATLKGAIAARLLAEDGIARRPEVLGTKVERPIFVTGLPRTGTTALHRLLGADPAHQGLELWLTEVPQPRPPREQWDSDPTYTGIRDLYAGFMTEHPDFGGVHYISADDLEECWQLLRQSFTSVSYECLAYLPSYSRWLAGADWRPAYARHKRNLQLIGANDPGKRWVLKNPSHLFALDALLDVYPDAVIVHTHRDPVKSMASMCSLAEHAAGTWSTGFTRERIGRTQLELWSRGLSEFTAARAHHPEATFVDVTHSELLDDAGAAVRKVYAAAGAEYTADVEAAVIAENAKSLSGARAPKHSYTLADYGLSAADVEAAFDGYRGA